MFYLWFCLKKEKETIQNPEAQLQPGRVVPWQEQGAGEAHWIDEWH